MQQYKDKYFKDFITTVKTLAVAWCIGPAIIVLAILMGGDYKDGATGSPRTNDPIHDTLFTLGSAIVLVVVVASFYASAALAKERAKSHKGYLVLPSASIVAPFALMFLIYTLS